jgi:hypothetical protein
MLKYTILFFCLVFANTVHAQEYTAADVVTAPNDTLAASFHLADTSLGDTVYFGMDASGHPLERFFLQNLTAPRSGSQPITGIARVYFILDKTGRVTQAWYDPSGNPEIGLSVLQIVNQMPSIRPTSVKGEPVITKVLLKVLVEDSRHPYTGTFVPDLTETAAQTVH